MQGLRQEECIGGPNESLREPPRGGLGDFPVGPVWAFLGEAGAGCGGYGCGAGGLFLFASNRNISLLCLKPFQNKKFQRLSFYMIEGDLIHVPRPCEHLEHVATGHRLLCLVPHPWASTARGRCGRNGSVVLAQPQAPEMPLGLRDGPSR